MRGGLAAAVAIIGASVTLAVSPAARAAELCAWMTETLEEEDFREVRLWLQADADVQFYYSMKGEGMKETGESGNRAHSPGAATFTLERGEPKKSWGFGVTLRSPAEIDIVAEIRAWPKDVFADEEPPLLTAFTFRRTIPDGEATPPPVLAEKQCRQVDFPPDT